MCDPFSHLAESKEGKYMRKRRKRRRTCPSVTRESAALQLPLIYYMWYDRTLGKGNVKVHGELLNGVREEENK